MALRLGHLVLYVRDLQVALPFYRDAIGLQETARVFNGRGVMLSGGSTHHELMLLQVGDAPGAPAGRRLGLYHFAFCVGESLQALRAAQQRLEAHGVPLRGMADHTITQSLYLADPDGNEVELYCDVPGYDWRTRREWIDAPVKPLVL